MADAEGAFYYWKSVYQPDSVELEAMRVLRSNRLYIKFFDVDWIGQANSCMPVAPIQWKGEVPSGTQVVPVVFVTNQSLQKTPLDSMLVLARQIHAKINDMAARLPFADTTFVTGKLRLPEVQIDCDWTQGTRQKYFNLLRYLKTLLMTTSDHTFRAELSATIRLHQIKYVGQSGVPPVDRGLLMCYNTGDLKNPKTVNSILHLPDVAPYLAKAESYPLQLDVALPLFSWGVLFRNGRFARLLNGLGHADLNQNPDFGRTGGNNYKALKINTLNGQRILKNDVLRVEEVSIGQLQAAADLLGKSLPAVQPGGRRLLFFHLDSDILGHYKPDDLLRLTK